MNEDLYLEKVAEEAYNLANSRSYGKHKYTPDEKGYGPEECEECGVEMPTVRREYGFCLCVKCKENEDRVNSQRR